MNVNVNSQFTLEKRARGNMDESTVSMQVSDTGGEISASVEETNRVRAALGLKPLKDTADNGGGADQQRNREEEARVRGQERAAEMSRADAEDAMREKLDAARRQRLLHQKLTGTSLGEQLAGEEMDSAAAWVASMHRSYAVGARCGPDSVTRPGSTCTCTGASQWIAKLTWSLLCATSQVPSASSHFWAPCSK